MFYCLVFAVASIPSVLLVRWGVRFVGEDFLLLCIFIFICFAAFYIFLVVSSIVVGFVERLITLGLRPGAYAPGSPVFFRWLIYSGLHLWLVNIVLPFLRGNNWIKVYLRISGAKVGKEVFINSKDFYDSYLLRIEDNVVIAGEAFVNCHTYEGGRLILGEIVIGKGTQICAKAYLTPGTRTGKNCVIGMNTYLRRNTDVCDGEALISSPGMTRRQILNLMRMSEKDKVSH
jgi:acetyltransferase-like isoleucine patch superfamily enzyme